jgi:hypothetical protein
MSRKRAQEAYDNPPIPEDFADQVAAALQYYDEERNGWNVQTIAEKSGLAPATVYKALKSRNDPTLPKPKGKGQKENLTDAAFDKLYAAVTKISLHLGAPESTVIFIDLIKKILREEAGNEFLEFEFSDSWLQKLRQRFLTFNKASIKSSDRVKAFERMRNHLSLCAVVWWMRRQGQRDELFYSSDDVSVLLNKMNDKPKVITTKEAKAILQAQGVAVSSSAEIQKQRVVTFNFTISGGGSVVCKVLKFADRDFTQFSKRPYVTVIDKDCEADRMYIMLHQ